MSKGQPDMPERKELKKRVAQQAARLKKADQERPTLLAQTAYIGVLGLLLVLPIVGGAYLGRWLDSQFEGYSLRWTISLIVVGLVVGGFNVYYFVRER